MFIYIYTQHTYIYIYTQHTYIYIYTTYIYIYIYIHRIYIYRYTHACVCVCGFQMGKSQNHGCMIWAYVHCLCPMWNPGFNHIILFSNEHMSKRSKQIQTYLRWKHLPNTHISKKFCLFSVVLLFCKQVHSFKPESICTWTYAELCQ